MASCMAKIVTSRVGSVSIMNSVIILTAAALMDVIQATVEQTVQKVLQNNEIMIFPICFCIVWG